METKLECEKIECFSAVYSNVLTKEETTELVVPDTMPDIARLLDTDGTIYMRSKTVRDGGLFLEGVIQAAVLYAGEEDDGVYRLDIQVPCAFSVDDDSLLETDKAVAKLHINSADTRTLNPRKVLFRADAAAQISVFRLSALDCFTCAADAGELQTLIQEKKISYIAAVEEKNFVVAEELILPAAKPAAAQILASRVWLSGEDTRQVGEKMILQGTAQAEVLYLAGESNIPIQERFSVSFSQILDIPGGDSGSSLVMLMPTASYIEPLPDSYGSNGFSLELHAAAQTVSRTEREIRYIADAYSTRNPCRVNREAIVVSGTSRTMTLRETIRDQIDTVETVEEICSTNIMVSLPEMEEGFVTIPVSVQILCLSERGNLFTVGKKMTAKLPLETLEDTEYVPEDIICSDPYVSSAGGGLEFRLPMEARLRIIEKETLDMILSVDVDTEEPLKTAEMPSLTIVRMGNNSLWTLAKKFGSTISLIEAANTGDLGTEDWLLIPRAR